MRQAFSAELEQMRLQVEVMAVRVEEALVRMRVVLASGDAEVAASALADDDEIDAMLVSLTERCYDLLRRESPVATDLRFLVSVLRLLEELERIGDLALRVVNSAPDHDLLRSEPEVLATLEDMAEVAAGLYRSALDAWSAQDPSAAVRLAARDRALDDRYAVLLAHLVALQGPDTARLAVAAVLVGRALERIADHAVIIGERLGYLLTADPAHLAAEIR